MANSCPVRTLLTRASLYNTQSERSALAEQQIVRPDAHCVDMQEEYFLSKQVQLEKKNDRDRPMFPFPNCADVVFLVVNDVPFCSKHQPHHAFTEQIPLFLRYQSMIL